MMMRMRLSRRSELFVPLALLLPALAGRARETAALAAAWALGDLCTLCGAKAFRAAAAQEIAPRRVRGAWTGALLTALLLSAAACGYGPALWTWLLAAPPDGELWRALWLTGAALPLARLADEHLRAAGQSETAALSAFLRAALLAGGLLCGLGWAAGAAALSAVVALILACAVGGRPAAAPNAAALRAAPAALWRALLYPLPGLLLLAGFWRRGAGWAVAGYLLGLALWDCAATPFRRARGESAPLRLLLVAPAAVLCALAPLLPAAAGSVAALTAFAAVAGLIAYAAPSPRGALSGLLLAASCLVFHLLPRFAIWAAPLCALLALAALLPDAREMRLRRRAARAKRGIARR